MKKIFHLLILFPILLIGQTQSENYIKTIKYKQPTSSTIANPDINNANVEIIYFDGLGKPSQKINQSQAGNGNNIITPIEYDEFERQTKDYLPYSGSTSGLNYEPGAINDIINFSLYQGETPYSEKLYDNSPLNKILKQAFPGNDWKLNSGHELKYDYNVNNALDVKKFKVSRNYNATNKIYNYTLISEGHYPQGKLYKNIVKDENWTSGLNNTTEEFKDLLGNIILKKTYNNGIAIETYYIRDDIGNLIYVLPPSVSDSIVTTQSSVVPYSYSKSIYYSDFLLPCNGTGSVSGGGGLYVSINTTTNNNIPNTTFSCNFNAGFSSAKIDLTKTFTLDLPGAIPNQDLINFNDYTLYIENNTLKFRDNTGNQSCFISLPSSLSISFSLNSNEFSQQTVNSYTIDQNLIENMSYQYKYDNYNRLVEKKLPGKQWEFIVYDKLDRVVATGPALSPFTDSVGTNGWLITKYDALNRPVLTAWHNITASAEQRGSLQNSVNTSSSLSENKTTSATIINGVGFNYTSAAWPTSGYHVLTVNYYDDYAFPHAETIPTTILGQGVYYNNTNKPKGLPTGSWVRATENSFSYKAETSITYYDYKARAIRIKTNNYLTGSTQIDNQFDFIGKILATETLHKRLNASSETLTREEFTYSIQDRLLTHTHQINGGIKQLIVKNTYDELGQLISKNVGGNDVTGSTSLQKVDYNYNIRGWLKDINNIDNLGNDLFAFKIKYNDNETNNLSTGEVAVPQLFNGNISETFWVTANDNIKRKYGYEYDNLNRLTFSKFQKFGSQRTNSFDENLTYDKNGNIVTLKRNGVNISTYDPSIDDLNYVYHPDNKNRLMKVTDSSLSSSGFKDGSSTGDDYDYDANGNMILDNNKGITSISYNHLNLPVKINYGVNKIEYIYNALGQKLRKTVTENGIISRTDYLGGYQYKSGVLEFFPHVEGYVKNTSGTYSYVFNYTDHLGNIRLSYSDTNQNGLIEKNNNEILEENHYYPFGLKHDTSGYGTNNYQPNYKYKYNGKEWQDELGLNMYDYGARNYDPALGRWMNIDPLAEKFYSESSYAYVNNDPLGYSDLDGKDYIIDIIRNKKGEITGINISGTVYIQGSGASQERANELNDFAKDNLKSKTVNGITIGVSLNYKYDKKKSEKNLKSGENILNFSNKPENEDNISHINALNTFNSAGKPVSLAGNTGVVFGNGSDNNTIFHESLHLLGLSDRYDDYRGDKTRPQEYQTTYPHVNYENNVMGNSRSTTLNKFQYEMWMKHALSRSKFHNNSNKVIGKMAVDRKGSFLMLPGDKTQLMKN